MNFKKIVKAITSNTNLHLNGLDKTISIKCPGKELTLDFTSENHVHLNTDITFPKSLSRLTDENIA